MLIPEDEDIIHRELNGHTKFVFPFNNADKPEEKAVEEITVGLCSLDETAILFLNHINTINYTLSDGRRGYIKVDDSVSSVKFIKRILVKKVDDNEVVSYWGKFNGQCPIVVNGKVKDNTVSIAYRMKRDDADKFSVDSNLIGKVCIFFPTDQKSDLRFHINAPFASTVARDNIRYCDENDKLIEALANLCVESLYYFRGVKMLDYSVYDALPTIRDFNNNPNSRYKIFAEKIKTEFESEELFISEQGDYKKSNDVMWASMDIKTVLPSLEVKRYYQKSWLPRFTPTSRTEFFIDQFKIEEFTIEDFIDSLEKDPHFFDALFSEQNTQYFKMLYALFAQSKEREYTNYPFLYTKKPTRNEILSNVAFILCEDKKVHGVRDNLFLRTDYQPKHYLNNPIYVDISLKDNMQDRNIKRFLLSIGVKEMSESEDMVAGLSNDNESVLGVWHDILKEIEKNPETINQYKDKAIFLARKANNDEISRVCASECCWSKEVAFFYDDKFIFAEDCYVDIKRYLPNIKVIFSNLGGKTSPKIIKAKLDDDYPLISSLKRERERSDTCVRRDYVIAEFDWNKLKDIKTKSLYSEALILWKLILRFNNRDVLHIVYKANASANEQSNLESSLVYYLKRMPWVPTKSGTYKCPYELTYDDLLEEFKYETPSLLLEAISKRPDDMVEQLKSKGVEDEKYLKFAGFDSDVQDKILAFGKELQAQKHKTGKSLTELAATSDREQFPEEDEYDNFGGFHKPKNLDKRKLKLEKEFDDREEPQTSIKKLRFVLEKSATEEKTFVKNEYHSHCQICRKEGILTAKGKRYFEAINILKTSELDEALQLNLGLGWNTLCLCPNCAAKFKYSQLTISSLIEQAQSININTAQSAFFDISISLEGKPTTIRFTPKHLLALQVAIKKIKEIESSDDYT